MTMNTQHLSRRSFILSAGAGIASASGLLSACSLESEPDTAQIENSPAVLEFGRLAKAFVESHRQEDGSVRPKAPGPGKAPVDVYLMVRRFSFEPGTLKLDRGVTYRFLVMAADVPHGIWIKTSDSGPLTLTPGVRLEQNFTFRKPGNYFAACSTYCGTGHDKMRVMIQVA